MTIRNRLLLIIMFTVGFAALSIFNLQQVSKGALFHQLNFLHQKYINQLEEHLGSGLIINSNLVAIEETIKRVRQQPIECLAVISGLDEFVMRIIGTDVAIQLCKDDIFDADLALEAITAYKNAKISQSELWVILRNAADHFQSNSNRFEAPIERTVQFISRTATYSVVVFAVLIVIAIAAIARGISITVRKKDESERSLFEARENLELSESELRDHRDKLEATVHDRTEQLRQEISNHEVAANNLRDANNRLKQTQAELVQSEKMASLGGLVAGVAHEINTPIGVSLTAISVLEEDTVTLISRFQSGDLKKSDLTEFSETASTSARIISANLKRAADLIKSFKQVAVDQSSQDKRRFQMAPYLDEILMTLQPSLKQHNHTITVTCDPELGLDSYPGALAQVITNLIMNSLIHGFEGVENGKINITILDTETDVQIVYADDGCGMDDETRNRVFDPFFTTKRGSGGSGLGMNIVFNLITQTLGGSIQCESSPGKGSSFIFTVSR